MSRRGSFALCLLFLGACERTSPPSVPATPDAGTTAVTAPAPVPAAVPPHVPLSPCNAGRSTPLDAALDYLDAGKHAEALSCAAQASALEPDSAAAHAARGEALASLNRTA